MWIMLTATVFSNFAQSRNGISASLQKFGISLSELFEF